MQHKQITGYHNLWFWVNEQTDKLDLNTSLIMPKHNFALTTGEAVYTKSYYETFDKFNELFGMNIDSKLSSVAGNTHFTIAFSEGKDAVQEEKEESSKAEEEKVTEQIEDVQEPCVEEEEIQPSEETVEDESTPVSPDWEWIATLGNNKEDKLALDQYAETKFGVKLSRTMKISNMIKVFKEELENK